MTFANDAYCTKFGLMRAEVLGGTLTIDAARGRGAAVRFECPLARATVSRAVQPEEEP